MHSPANVVNPLWTTLPYAYAFWTVYVLSFALESRVFRRGRGAKEAKARDGGSVWVVMGLMFIALVLGFLFSGIMPPIARITWHTPVWFVSGLGLMLVGAGIRQIAISTLGRYFTAKVMIQPDHELVQHGLYRYVRHPSYTGAFLMWLGLGLALTNIVSLILIFGMAVLAYGWRVRVEEKALKEALDSGYEAYCRRTKRFIPGLF